ncbi:hypothetical protein J5289_12760 [Rhizobium sp. B230/85]|uniref:hypothetical protein n=2 Tax=unclassified Rhizobium TaxID=2613769 RepID=UPI001ADCAF4E|nr:MULTISPECIES: hypothetical protein [unclassified Rhizobium]MBO9132403.1 hypothetical protein [Rhizobium sp. B209b/85]QXZ95067.1 hypothetical protein J5289_12760 [Rhizobium sp. B230/85]
MVGLDQTNQRCASWFPTEVSEFNLKDGGTEACRLRMSVRQFATHAIERHGSELQGPEFVSEHDNERIIMTNTLHKADATGKLELANETAPVSYSVTVATEKENGKFAVTLLVKAPRDWLLKRGFTSSATLVRHDGDQVELHHDGELDVGEAVSVELSAVDTSCSDDSELQRKYPELRG